MSVLVLVDIPVKPDRVEDAKAQFARILGDTRAFDGCEGVTVHHDQGELGMLLLVERWVSRAHYETYTAWRRTEEGNTGLAEMLTGPPVARYFDELDA